MKDLTSEAEYAFPFSNELKKA